MEKQQPQEPVLKRGRPKGPPKAVIEEPAKVKGRPKGTTKFTEEEKRIKRAEYAKAYARKMRVLLSRARLGEDITKTP